MIAEKKRVMQFMEENLRENKRIEFSFLLRGEEYICTSLDVFGTGKPEFVVLGNDIYRQSITVSSDENSNKAAIHNLLASFPEQLEMTIIPNECMEEEHEVE